MNACHLKQSGGEAHGATSRKTSEPRFMPGFCCVNAATLSSGAEAAGKAGH